MPKYLAFVVVATLIAVGPFPSSAEAQERSRAGLLTGTFAALAERGDLEPGKNLLVTFKLHTAGGYQQMKLKLVRLTDSAIFVEVEKEFSPASTDLNLKFLDDSGTMLPFKSLAWAILEIPERRVSRIAGIDGLGNGALIGAAIGAAPMAFTTISSGGCGDWAAFCLASMGIMAGAGAGIGLAADYARVREGTVYYEAVVLTAPTLTWSPVPLVSKDRKGVLFVLTW